MKLVCNCFITVMNIQVPKPCEWTLENSQTCDEKFDQSENIVPRHIEENENSSSIINSTEETEGTQQKIIR